MTRSALRLGVVLVTGGLALSACAGALPEETGPSGVDGLVIPTPSPDPDDFVAGIDNPWLPLSAGTTWRYRSGTDGTTVTVSVTDQTRRVQGVTTTVVDEAVTTPGGDLVAESSAWFAQDAEGNVWSFGEQRTAYGEGGHAEPRESWEWEAGVDGARAGVAMLASPRVGDGYRQQYAEGTAEDRATVLSLDATVSADLTSYTNVLEIEETSDLEPTVVHRQYYVRGTGLVAEQPAAAPGDGLVLVAHDPA